MPLVRLPHIARPSIPNDGESYYNKKKVRKATNKGKMRESYFIIVVFISLFISIFFEVELFFILKRKKIKQNTNCNIKHIDTTIDLILSFLIFINKGIIIKLNKIKNNMIGINRNDIVTMPVK
jgi:hypothetical protein